MKKIFFIFNISICLVPLLLHGQVKFVNEFLNIGVGARSQAMAGSVVASVSDGTSGYWNPAGLIELDVPLQLNAMHAEWFGGIANYDYISVAKRLNAQKGSYASLSVIRLGVDDIPNTLNLVGPDGSINYDKITNFSAADYAFLLSYATRLNNPKLSVGGNIKVIRRVIGPFANAWGFGADLGLKYRLSEKLTLAVSGRDITSTFNSWSFNLDEESKEVFRNTNNEIPVSSTESTLPRFILGAAYKGMYKKFTYLGEANINVSTDGTQASLFSSNNFGFEPSFGMEIGYANKVFVRAGIGNFQQSTSAIRADQVATSVQPNVGLGLNLGRLKVDYALANVGGTNGTLSSHIFSLTLDFRDRTVE